MVRVLLARRLRHDLHAGVEDLLAGQHQPRLAAAEEHREQLPKWPLTVSKVSLQQLARLAVDAADRVLQRVDGLVEVGRLRVEEALALARPRRVPRARRG